MFLSNNNLYQITVNTISKMHTHLCMPYPTEAARAVLDFAFTELALEDVVSFTAVINQRSQLVMQRLGMTDTQDNFSHPMLDANHPLAEHVLYKITRQEWQALTV